MSDLKVIEAVKRRHIEALQQALEEREDINQQDENGWAPLNWAAGAEILDIVKLLVENGANLTHVGRDRRTPYMIALAAGHVEVAKFLRQAEDRAQVDRTGEPERQYCRAYPLNFLRQYPCWSENTIDRREKSDSDFVAIDHEEGGDTGLSDDAIVYLHQDFTVTRSMWRGEDVVFDQVGTDWKRFCTDVLRFKIPDDFDLIVPVGSPDLQQPNL